MGTLNNRFYNKSEDHKFMVLGFVAVDDIREFTCEVLICDQVFECS